jgi:hypothetical protein
MKMEDQFPERVARTAGIPTCMPLNQCAMAATLAGRAGPPGKECSQTRGLDKGVESDVGWSAACASTTLRSAIASIGQNFRID